jgi:hypothetical protein
MIVNESTIHYEIKALRFGRHGKDGLSVAIVRGDATVNGVVSRFELILTPIADGQWRYVNLGWLTSSPPPPILGEQQFIQALVNSTARLLDTINMWPSEQTGGGARLCLNERVITEDVRDRVLVSFRSNILSVPSASWQLLWDHIERRADADPFFEVLGFDRATVQRVLPSIREIFPNDWTRARYTAAGHSGMADQFEPGTEGWFPAYHLARTAHGAICRDPGWNYLIEIGLALEALQEFDGADRLKRQLAKNPGTQHHVCLAADLHERGVLKGLEPPTGVGAASNDLLVELGGRSFQVEVKEFTSRKPAKRLQREIADKVGKLPRRPEQPIVFHVVLSENGMFDKEREDGFLDAITELQGRLPDKISAVVAGKRFVDSKGGRIKRDIGRVVTNATAITPIDEQDLRVVFETNYSDAEYPFYGIGSFFVFGNSPSA